MVWEHLIASDSERMILAARGIWVTDWMAGAKQFSFLILIESCWAVSVLRGGGCGREMGGSRGATCELVFLSQGTAVY